MIGKQEKGLTMIEILLVVVIRLRRRPRALPADVRPALQGEISPKIFDFWRKCEKFLLRRDVRRWGKASGSLSADNPLRFDSRSESAGGKTGYPGLCPGGSIIGVLAAIALPSYRIQMLKMKNQEAVRILMYLK